MSSIDIFSKINLTKKEAFNYLINANTVERCVSPFFTIQNLRSKNSRLDINTHFVQKCVFSELLQLYYRVKDIVEGEKIVFEFSGLINGTQTVYLLDNPSSEHNCLIREKIEFSLFNQFSIPMINWSILFFLYMDTLIKHFRLKSLIKKNNGLKSLGNEYLTIKSYIVVDADLKEINSLFEDLTKLSLWLSPLFKIKSSSNNIDIGKDFSIELTFPLLPLMVCKILKKDLNQFVISFENSLLSGKNTWSFIPCEKEFVIENSIEINNVMPYLNLIWLVFRNTLVRNELISWNNRLKHIVEKSSLYKHLELVPQIQ